MVWRVLVSFVRLVGGADKVQVPDFTGAGLGKLRLPFLSSVPA